MVLEANLVCDLRMNEGSGTVTLDRSKNDAKGTFGAGAEAPTWVDGKWGIGKAISFDGGDILAINDLVTLLALAEIGAVELWCKIDSDSGNIEFVYSLSRTADGAGTDFWVAYRTDAGKDYFEVKLRADTVVQWQMNTIEDSIDPYIGKYVHLFVVQDGVEPVLYVNGVLMPVTFSFEADKTAWFKKIITDPVDPVDVSTVGASRRAAGALELPFTGDVQVLRIYDAVPTAAQVRALYAEGLLNLKDGLVLDLEFKEGTGLVTRDQSGEDHVGTLGVGGDAPTWVAGGGLTFDGINDELVVPDDASLSPSDELTIAVWFNMVERKNNQGIVWKNTLNYILTSDAGNTNFSVWDTDGDQSQASFSSLNMEFGALQHIVGGFGADHIARLYLNGVSIGTPGDPIDNIRDQAGDLFIGIRGDLVAGMDGTLKSVKMWDRGISPREVRELFAQG